MTKEVLYNLNGKYFKDFGVFISESKGLLDKPKLKSRRSYDWAEYHGKAVDLDKPKYDEREIELKGWVEGETWSQMKTNFDTLLSEFDKEGLQRLVIEYLGNALVFDVYLSDGVELEKSFKEGKMVGLFTLKMKDPNPIKRVFKLIGNDLQLSFNAQSWVDINIDGINETRKGNITINKALPSRELSGYGFYSRNYIKNSSKGYGMFNNNGRTLDLTQGEENGVRWISGTSVNNGNFYISTYFHLLNNISVFTEDLTGQETIQSMEVKPTHDMYIGLWENNRKFCPANVWTKIENSPYNNTRFIGIYAIWNNDGSVPSTAKIYHRNWKLEKGNKATDWTPAPEDTHYITISGNTDEITNLQTNAEELWSL
ncbi:galactose-binding protein [Riemerella anatipestifer]|uniref:galactose-binding protein n=1 Tax=Riemerella anatipestifer TaxID=34085 RepID=UPI0021D5883E|nr:galactose-binding protein [Riemerella anatipestifer]MCU7570482.1 galactose-binding protein [Riemerella anatipestifer]